MIFYADPAQLPGMRSALGVPETIGCRAHMLAIYFPDVSGKMHWQSDAETGVVSTQWTRAGLIAYELELRPSTGHVDIVVRVTNLSSKMLHDVFAFNCLNPVRAPQCHDTDLQRTYLSQEGQPVSHTDVAHSPGRRPSIRIYRPVGVGSSDEHPFVTATGGTSPDRTDGGWLAALSEPPGFFIAAQSQKPLFLFTNRDRSYLHVAADFGGLAPQQASSSVTRLYMAVGELSDCVARLRSWR